MDANVNPTLVLKVTATVQNKAIHLHEHRSEARLYLFIKMKSPLWTPNKVDFMQKTAPLETVACVCVYV